MSSGPGGSGEGEGFDQTDAETQAQMAEAGLLGSFADPGETGENVDAAFTAMQDINQEPPGLEDYDVTGAIVCGVGNM